MRPLSSLLPTIIVGLVLLTFAALLTPSAAVDSQPSVASRAAP